jgi:Beta-lactamase enzyme family
MKNLSFSRYALCILFALSAFSPYAFAQPKTDKFLTKLLQKSPELFGEVLQNPAKYDVQILYTQISRDAQNQPSFKSYRYRLDKNRYFYPASTVKFPAVLLALEKLNALKISRETTMLTDSSASGQTSVRRDASAQNGLPSVGQYARKILLVSDNDAYNRLYEFIGQCDFNQKLYAKGYQNLRIMHRLSLPLTAAQNSQTNPVRFLEGDAVRAFPAQTCTTTPQAQTTIKRGTGYMTTAKNGKDSLVQQPFDFTAKNYFALEDQQQMLRAVLFPDAVSPKQRFNLTGDDYQFLYRNMSMFPRESRYPAYDSTHYDAYCKFLLAGDRKWNFPKSVRIFNKVGDAYGYLIDNAYVVDFDRGVEFMLSAVIYCNQDGVFNDDKYDYDKVGFPFLGNLGRIIYDYETKRKRINKPDLSKFRVEY